MGGDLQRAQGRVVPRDGHLAAIVATLRLQVAATMPDKQRPLIVQAILHVAYIWHPQCIDEVATRVANMGNKLIHETWLAQANLSEFAQTCQKTNEPYELKAYLIKL